MALIDRYIHDKDYRPVVPQDTECPYQVHMENAIIPYPKIRLRLLDKVPWEAWYRCQLYLSMENPPAAHANDVFLLRGQLDKLDPGLPLSDDIASLMADRAFFEIWPRTSPVLAARRRFLYKEQGLEWPTGLEYQKQYEMHQHYPFKDRRHYESALQRKLEVFWDVLDYRPIHPDSFACDRDAIWWGVLARGSSSAGYMYLTARAKRDLATSTFYPPRKVKFARFHYRLLLAARQVCPKNRVLLNKLALLA